MVTFTQIGGLSTNATFEGPKRDLLFFIKERTCCPYFPQSIDQSRVNLLLERWGKECGTLEMK